MSASFAGLKCIESIYCVKRWQFRFPHSKKKRIRAKWSKRNENWKSLPDPQFYQIGDTLVGHPQTFEALRQVVEKPLKQLFTP